MALREEHLSLKIHHKNILKNNKYYTILYTIQQMGKESFYIMSNQLSESKLWESITAVASSIMTNLLYNFISNDSYVVQPDGTQYIISSDTNNMKNNASAFVFTILIFFTLWGILLIAIHICPIISKQLKYKKIKFHSRSDLINELNTAKEQTLFLKDIFYNEQNIILNMDIAVLQMRTLASTVSSLHAKFIPHNKQQKKHMRDNFRHPTHSAIFNINGSISKYEFISLIRILEKMTYNMSLHTYGDELLNKDCKEMLKMLEDLKNLAI